MHEDLAGCQDNLLQDQLHLVTQMPSTHLRLQSWQVLIVTAVRASIISIWITFAEGHHFSQSRTSHMTSTLARNLWAAEHAGVQNVFSEPHLIARGLVDLMLYEIRNNSILMWGMLTSSTSSLDKAVIFAGQRSTSPLIRSKVRLRRCPSHGATDRFPLPAVFWNITHFFYSTNLANFLSWDADVFWSYNGSQWSLRLLHTEYFIGVIGVQKICNRFLSRTVLAVSFVSTLCSDVGQERPGSIISRCFRAVKQDMLMGSLIISSSSLVRLSSSRYNWVRFTSCSKQYNPMPSPETYTK